MKTITIIKGQGALQKAKQKARYGHRDWIKYTDKAGEPTAELISRESIKRAMLSIGTKGSFHHIGRDGISMIISWPIAVNIFNQCKYR